MQTFRFVSILLLSIVWCCSSPREKNAQPDSPSEQAGHVSISPFGVLNDGTTVSIYTMTNRNGVTMKVINYGGIIVSLHVPDRDGKLVDVVLGYDSLATYEKRNPFFGALVGRYGNRISKGKLVLDGNEYKLTINNDGNHIHGGKRGFDKVFWKGEEVATNDGVAIKLSYLSKHMEEGYPGNLNVDVIYTLTDDNAARFDYHATTDQKTIVNLTQHTYFNLNGGASDILNHELTLNADRFLPVDEKLIPTGEIRPVENTPLDFRTPMRIGERINDSYEQMRFGKGYDHCWVLNGKGLRDIAEVFEPLSGIEMTVKTTEPSVQLYTGNFLDGTIVGKNGVVYKQRMGFCLETQHFPDSPNQSTFPSVILNPGETYRTTSSYHFSVRK